MLRKERKEERNKEKKNYSKQYCHNNPAHCFSRSIYGEKTVQRGEKRKRACAYVRPPTSTVQRTAVVAVRCVRTTNSAYYYVRRGATFH